MEPRKPVGGSNSSSKTVRLDHHRTLVPLQEIAARLPSFFSMSGDEGEVVIKNLLGADPAMQLFLGGSDEEMTWALFMAVYRHSVRELGRTELLVMTPSLSSRRLEALGCSVKLVPMKPTGEVDTQALFTALRPRTALLSIPWAHPVTGVIQPVAEIAALCQAQEVLFHVDVTAALGREFLHLEDLPSAYVTFEGTALGALPGTAALLTPPNSPLDRSFFTSSSPRWLIDLLAFALQKRLDEFNAVSTHSAQLRQTFEEGVRVIDPTADLLFQGSPRLPHCTLFAFPGIHGEMLLYALKKQGVTAALGAPKHLMQLGIDPLLAHSAISVALSPTTCAEEISAALRALHHAFEEARYV